MERLLLLVLLVLVFLKVSDADLNQGVLVFLKVSDADLGQGDLTILSAKTTVSPYIKLSPIAKKLS